MEDVRCNKCTFMLAFIELSFLTLHSDHCLPASQMTITASLVTFNIAIAVTDSRCRLFIKCHSIFDCLPLLCTQLCHITREAHAAKKRTRNGVADTLHRISLSDNCPDLTLSWKNCPMKCCCNNWNFLALVRIREGCHAALTHHQWL